MKSIVKIVVLQLVAHLVACAPTDPPGEHRDGEEETPVEQPGDREHPTGAFVIDSDEGESTLGGGTEVTLDKGVCADLPVQHYRLGGYGHGDSVGNGRVHAGVDVSAAAGTDVVAPLAGWVVWAGPGGTGWGGLIEVQVTLADGTVATFVFGHLDPDSIDVDVGDQVEVGQYLGAVGTRDVNGGWVPHLHFSVFKGAAPTSGVLQGHVLPADLAHYADPIPFLEAHARCITTSCSLEWVGQPESIHVGETTSACFTSSNCDDLRVDLLRANESPVSVVAAPIAGNCVDIEAYSDAVGNSLRLRVSTRDGASSAASATSNAFNISHAPAPAEPTPAQPVLPAPLPETDNSWSIAWTLPANSDAASVEGFVKNDARRIWLPILGHVVGTTVIWDTADFEPDTRGDVLVLQVATSSGEVWACSAVASVAITDPSGSSRQPVPVNNGLGGCDLAVGALAGPIPSSMPEPTTNPTPPPAPAPTPAPTPTPSAGSWQITWALPSGVDPSTAEVFIKNNALLIWMAVPVESSGTRVTARPAAAEFSPERGDVLVLRAVTTSGTQIWACAISTLTGVSVVDPAGMDRVVVAQSNGLGGCDAEVK